MTRQPGYPGGRERGCAVGDPRASGGRTAATAAGVAAAATAAGAASAAEVAAAATATAAATAAVPALPTVAASASVGARRPRLARVVDWLVPWGALLAHGSYFRRGLERGACRAIHRAAVRGTLYSFAPPPPLRLVARGRGQFAADEYQFRSPFVSHIAVRNDAFVRHYRGASADRPLVVLNHGAGSFALLPERYLIGQLLAAGVDVALPAAPGFYRRRRRRDLRQEWAVTVGAALSAVVQLVHDNVAIESWARRAGYRTVIVSGIGLGGTVAAVLAATTVRFDAYVPALAGAHPGRLWLPPRPLARAVNRSALARAGVRHGRALARLFDPVAPNRLPVPRRIGRCTVVGLRFDTLVPPDDVRDLAAHWRVVPMWLPRSRIGLGYSAGELVAIVVDAARRARS